LIEDYLDEIISMEVGISDEAEDYDLLYISSKLALCAKSQERLSEIQLHLTKISIGVSRTSSDISVVLKAKERALKADPSYVSNSREERGHWLDLQLGVEKKEDLIWQDIKRTVSTIREVLGDRVQTIRRLDSDLRLHQKLFEAKVASGAVSGLNLPKGSSKDLELE
jgi:hypothetical protein